MADKTCVIGLWHLGCVYSAGLADLGGTVTGYDPDAARVAALNDGKAPLYEPGLDEQIAANIRAGRLSYTSDVKQAVSGAAYVLVTFDTPVDENDESDLTAILETAAAMAPFLESGVTVVISSQVPIGTGERIRALIRERNPGLAFDVACSPENLRLGQAIAYFKHPDRIVIGADSKATLDKVDALFRAVDAPKLRMSLRTAEMTKHAINAFLATCVSFANELANLADRYGADALKVAEALKSESRIGNKLPLLPGLAFGGGTLARDLKTLKRLGDEAGYAAPLIEGVLAVNRRQNGVIAEKLRRVYGTLAGLTVGVLGLTYKPGTSTLRRSAALEIIAELAGNGVIVRAYDPQADPAEVSRHPEIERFSDPYAMAGGVDALIIVTDWPEFKELDFDRLKSLMKKPVLVDGKNMLYQRNLAAAGFIYLGIGTGDDYGQS